MKKLSRFVQICFLALFVVLFLKTRYPFKDEMGIEFFFRLSPLLPIVDVVQNYALNIDLLIPGVLIVAITYLFGRFFCSWICPLGALLDLFSWLFKPFSLIKPFPAISTAFLRKIPAFLLMFSIFTAALHTSFWAFFDPISITLRFFTLIFFPIFSYFGTKIINFSRSFQPLEEITSSIVRYWEKLVLPEGINHVSDFHSVVFLLVIIFGLEFFSRRFWCRYVCPSGCFLGLISKSAYSGIQINSSCVSCGQCVEKCPMGAIEKDISEKALQINRSLCTLCFDCIYRCPPNVRALDFSKKTAETFNESSSAFTRRDFLRSISASIAAFGLTKIVQKNPSEKAFFIRPPGAIPEEEFLEKCIKCMACVRMCKSNGSCLQPSPIKTDILELWTPVAVMRTGYCEYNCNLCGQICPTQAIKPLQLEKKQKLSIGKAVFETTLCIPYSRGEDCLVCEEHCPVPQKAIKFRERKIKTKNGTKTIKRPYVDYSLCIGCGICEHKCPLPSRPGIYITSDKAD
ncbi:MAG: 4Fe-4S binding protein [Candidatus Riflebacteria bacterium]|nr:4Fe-4S binding protein [Candidatus Riflebacteria bacterium]